MNNGNGLREQVQNVEYRPATARGEPEELVRGRGGMSERHDMLVLRGALPWQYFNILTVGMVEPGSSHESPREPAGPVEEASGSQELAKTESKAERDPGQSALRDRGSPRRSDRLPQTLPSERD